MRALSSTLRRIGGRTRIPQGATPARAGTLSRRAREQLLEAISSGLYPDDRLPPEAQLAIALGVSRTTLRAALQSLADDGILNRRRRHGTSINRGLPRNQLRLNRLISFSALIEQSGHVASVDLQQSARHERWHALHRAGGDRVRGGPRPVAVSRVAVDDRLVRLSLLRRDV